MCSAFLLTPVGHAETTFFDKAQTFFSQSQKAVKNYLISGKGLDDKDSPPNSLKKSLKSKSAKVTNKLKRKDLDIVAGQTSYEDQSDENIISRSTSSNTKMNDQNLKYAPPKALYFSILSKSISDNNDLNPNYGLSLAISIPVYSSFSILSSEFQISGDIKNAGDWGQVQFLQKEAFQLVRLADTRVELFMGLGFGLGHGSKIVSEDRYFAPWSTGIQWGKIYRNDKVFYRFELGWTGDFYFADAKYSQGLLANMSLGYKL